MYFIWEYFPCSKKTFNKFLPCEREGGGVYLQYELEERGLIERGAYLRERRAFIRAFTVCYIN